MVTVLGRDADRHLVDAYGLVGCPLRATDVDVDVCLGCPELLEAVTDEDGHVTEIRCRPAAAARRDAFDLGFPGWLAIGPHRSR
jgi:hypothetical protein